MSTTGSFVRAAIATAAILFIVSAGQVGGTNERHDDVVPDEAACKASVSVLPGDELKFSSEVVAIEGKGVCEVANSRDRSNAGIMHAMTSYIWFESGHEGPSNILTYQVANNIPPGKYDARIALADGKFVDVPDFFVVRDDSESMARENPTGD